MRTILGVVLVLVGGAVVLYAIYHAVTPLIGLYQANLTDPLNQPEGMEQKTSDAMWQAVKIGAAGAVPLLIGTVLLKISLYVRLRRLLGPK